MYHTTEIIKWIPKKRKKYAKKLNKTVTKTCFIYKSNWNGRFPTGSYLTTCRFFVHCMVETYTARKGSWVFFFRRT